MEIIKKGKYCKLQEKRGKVRTEKYKEFRKINKFLLGFVVLLFGVVIVLAGLEIAEIDKMNYPELSPVINNSNGIQEKYIAVALHWTQNELRLLNLSYNVIAQADFANRIEALAVGDANNDGKNDIIVGLDGTNSPQLYVVYFDEVTKSLTSERISDTLPLHIETIDVGDADGDGQNEIVVGIEPQSRIPGPVTSRLRMYKLNSEGWDEIQISSPDTLAVEDLKIADPDDDGKKEIVALFANYGGLGPRQIRIYSKNDSAWVMEPATPLVTTGAKGAERIFVGDADGDGDNEIIAGYYDYYNDGDSKLVMIDKQGSNWIETILSYNVGVVDGITILDFNSNGRPEIIFGPLFYGDSKVSSLELDSSNIWQRRAISPIIGAIWDVDFGDVDGDGQDEIIIANDLNLRKIESGIPTQANIIKSFSTFIDSAMMFIPTILPVCGDGEINQPTEECDDGDDVDNDECSNTCKITKYYNVFVTRNSYSGRIAYGSQTGLSAANGICADEARGYFGSMKKFAPLISTSTTSASSIIAKNSRNVAWKTPDKKLVARGVSDLLDGSLENAMITTIHGTALAQGTNVWTGSLANGQLSGVNCNNWNSNTGTGTYGVTGAIDGTWMNAGATSCNAQARIYCVEVPFCGNGISEGFEHCDDGNTNNNDGCTTLCNFGSGGSSGTPKEISPSIGDLTA